VVVRPESVRAIIEVKGSANKKEINDVLESFLDFGQKWHECQLFYHERNQPLTQRPRLYVMCWNVGHDKTGRLLTNGVKIRKQIASFYKARSAIVGLKGFPRLEKLFIYNECEVGESGWTMSGSQNIELGYVTDFGKFVRHNSEGVPEPSGDRTIASLLAGLHYAVGDDFNRFYSYVDETRQIDPTKYKHHGFTAWLPDCTRDANTDFVIDFKK
jgi:hypothetical protein